MENLENQATAAQQIPAKKPRWNSVEQEPEPEAPLEAVEQQQQKQPTTDGQHLPDIVKNIGGFEIRVIRSHDPSRRIYTY